MTKLHSLVINIQKTKYMVFSNKEKTCEINFFEIDGIEVKKEGLFKYLGVVFTENMSIESDIERSLKSFLSQFNSMYYKFNFLDNEQLIFLFTSYCTSFYGTELWYDALHRVKMFDSISVMYHRAIKKMLGVSKYYNNHDVCQTAKLPIFKHLIIKRIVSFLFKLTNNTDTNFYDLKHYFKNESHLAKMVKQHMSFKYGIENIFNNCIQAIHSRIDFTQRHEESSGYVPAVN